MYKKEIVYSLLLWIDENLNKKITICRISEKSGYSRWYIQRMFKEVTQISIYKYIKQRRLEKAIVELCNTKKKITDIALDYQYDSCQSFSRAFYKEFHKSPMQYRKENRLL